MDKKLVDKFKLAESIAKMQMISNYRPKVGLNEYSFITKPLLGEDGEDGTENQQSGPQMEVPGQQPPMETSDQQQQGQSPMGEQPPLQGGQMPQGQEMPMDNSTVDGVGTDVQPETSGEEIDIDTDVQTQGGDEEVIDVDDLTNAQEATENKVDSVDDKLTSLIRAVSSLQKVIDSNDQKILDLQAEIERRNPTPEEKLNIRSQSSFPYNSTPRQYWDEKTSDPNSNYSVSYENGNSADDKDSHKFDILAQDIKNLNLKSVSDSLDDMPDLSDYLDDSY